MKKKIIILLVLLLAVIFTAALAGCNTDSDNGAPEGPGNGNGENGPENGAAPGDGDNGSENGAAPGDGDNGSENGGSEERFVRITLYFSNKQAIVDGEPGETGYVSPVTRTLPYTLSVLKLSMEELIRGPQAEDGDLGRTLPVTLELLSVTIEDRVAIINFSEELVTAADAPGGSLGGSVTTQSIVLTATQFPSVDAVMVKVNGEPWCDGHAVWDWPITRENLGL